MRNGLAKIVLAGVLFSGCTVNNNYYDHRAKSFGTQAQPAKHPAPMKGYSMQVPPPMVPNFDEPRAPPFRVPSREFPKEVPKEAPKKVPEPKKRTSIYEEHIEEKTVMPKQHMWKEGYAEYKVTVLEGDKRRYDIAENYPEQKRRVYTTIIDADNNGLVDEKDTVYSRSITEGRDSTLKLAQGELVNIVVENDVEGKSVIAKSSEEYTMFHQTVSSYLSTMKKKFDSLAKTSRNQESKVQKSITEPHNNGFAEDMNQMDEALRNARKPGSQK